MDVIEVSIQILLVADDLIPEAVLPNSPGAVSIAGPTGKRDFESVNDTGNTLRTNVYNRMEMIWQ